MFSLFKKKERIFSIKEEEILFFKNVISILPKKYFYLYSQINEDFLLGFQKHSLNYKDSYFIVYNAKLEKLYLNKKLPNFFILKNIKVWNIKKNDFCTINLNILSGILGGFNCESIDFSSFDFNRIDISEINEKHFENKDLDTLIKNFKDDEKNLVKENIGNTYQIDLKEGKFYFFDDLTDGDVIALDNLWNVYILTHDPFKVKNIFSKAEFVEMLKNGNFKEEVLKKCNTF